MPLDKMTYKHIENLFRSPQRKSFHRDFKKTYLVKGRNRTRTLQFLRPQIYCFAYPEYEKHIVSRSRFVTAKIVNAGGAPSTNTVVQFIRHHATQPTQSHEQKIALQPGQTRELKFAFGPIPLLSSSSFQLVCYDPLHDPIAQAVIPQSSFHRCLVNATEPQLKSNGTLTSWKEWSRQSNGTWQPASPPTWTTKNHNLSVAIVNPLHPKKCFATSDQTPRLGSQLRQTVSVASLNLGGHMLRQFNSGQLRASLDGLIHLHGNTPQTKGWLEVDFENSTGTVLSSFSSPHHSTLNQWHRVTGSLGVPNQTANIVFKMVADRPPGNAVGQVYFDELHLTLTPRNVFTSDRIYSP